MDVSQNARVSATVILDQLKLMRKTYGESAVSRALAKLEPDVRREIDELLAGGWCSIRGAYELKAAIAAEVSEDVLVLQRRVAKLGIEQTLTTLWRFFLRQLSDEMIVKRTPIVYARTFDRGSLELVRIGKRECDFELRGWAHIPEFDLVGLMAGIETVLELAGRKAVRVGASRRSPVVDIHATWID